MWDAHAARHLLRRAGFAPRMGEVTAAVQAGLRPTVRDLLGETSVPQQPDWAADAPFPIPLTQEQQQIYSARKRELREWWARLMLTGPPSLHEKLTLFWHGHFATQMSDVKVPQLMFRQNALFRAHALGNFRELVKAVAVDPAMLIYLDGVRNRTGNPNENFARELLELFTIGINNYTQTDIQEAARAFTGWQVSGLEPVFNPARHDDGVKTFLGHTGRFRGEDIIEIILEQQETARFICRKLCRFFMTEAPPAPVVDALAAIFRNNNYKLRPVLETLFLSSAFFQTGFRAAKIAGPVERTVGAVRQLQITIDPASPSVPKFIRTETPDMGQELLEPPNVAGWPGGREWVTTTTLLLRQAFTDAIVRGRNINNGNIGFKVDPLALATATSAPDDPHRLVADLCIHLLPMPISAERRTALVEVLLQGIDPGDWSLQYPEAGARIESLLTVMLRMAEYQLA